MKNKFCLILPNIRSCHNVGAMFRTADAFAVDKIFLVGYTACPPKIQIDKVALGAEKWVKWEKREDLKRLLGSLQKKGFYIIGLEKTKNSRQITKSYRQWQDKDVALLVGNEVEGISSEILSLCDIVVHIPMQGRKESLNVSVAAGIALYEIGREVKNL